MHLKHSSGMRKVKIKINVIGQIRSWKWVYTPTDHLAKDKGIPGCFFFISKIISRYEELDKDGEVFTCQLTLIYKKENGVNGEEEVFEGTGKSKKEAKHDSAFNALQRSYILQSVRGGMSY